VRSITKPIANERLERPFDRDSDANDPRQARGAVGRKINERFSGETMTRTEKNPPGKSERQRHRVISLKLLVTGAAEHVGAVV
jgi:hypothetical protein